MTIHEAMDLILEADGAPMTRDELREALDLLGVYCSPTSVGPILWQHPELFYRVDPVHYGPRQALYGRTAWRAKEGTMTQSAIPPGAQLTTCRSCGAPIYFETTKNGKQMPISLATGETHFADCPQAKQWSKSVQRRIAAQTERS